MAVILSSKQMQAIEERFFQSDLANPVELMAKAGEAFVAAFRPLRAELQVGERGAVHVLCGPGNNGGDGYVVSRLLLDLGEIVNVWAFGDGMPSSPQARRMRDEWIERGDIRRLQDFEPSRLSSNELVIDALFGIGLSRAIPADMQAKLVEASTRTRMVSIDILSGLDSDNGRFLSEETSLPKPVAAATVAFQCSKRGHYLGEGSWLTGRLIVASIGLEAELEAYVGQSGGVARTIASSHLPLGSFLEKVRGMHKYGYGHAIVLAGGTGRGGAGRLAARAALRVGTGLVTLCCPGDAISENASQLNAIMLREISSEEDLVELLDDDRINAACLGPGLGLGETTRSLVKCILDRRIRLVLDADALSTFGGVEDDLVSRLHEDVVLTPHFGEFSTLFPDIAGDMSGRAGLSKMDAVLKASRRCGCTILLKGHDTVVGSKDGQLYVADNRSFPHSGWLATAGSGDVLAGLATGLLARGINPVEAVATAVLLHLEAASQCGAGLIAEDLPEAMPAVLSRLGL